MSRMDIPGIGPGADLNVPGPGLALIAVVEAVHPAVPIAGPGPRPACPGHVQGLTRGGVGAAVFYHGDAVIRHPASNLIATPPIVAMVITSVSPVPVQSS